MADAVDLGVVVAVSVAINTVSALKTGKDPVVTLTAGTVMYAGLLAVGGLTNKWELPIAFAWVFLIGSVVGRGIPLLNLANGIANVRPVNSGKSAANGKANPKASSGGRSSGGSF